MFKRAGSLSQRRRTLAVIVVCVTAAAFGLKLLDFLIGNAYFSRVARVRSVEIAEVSRLSALRRPLQFGEPLEQNAAIWYRRLFARVPEPSQDALNALRIVEGSDFNDDGSLAEVDETTCPFARGRQLDDALRCTACDWELHYDGHSLDTLGLPAGNCGC
jgi:hypothetical protein